MSSATSPTRRKSESHMNDSGHESSNRVSRRKSKYDRALLGRYKLIRTIGTGNFAKVKLAIHLLTGKEVAIKVIDKNELSSSSRKKLSREVNLMKLLDHPHIVKLLEIIQTDKMMYLVLEYASGGELYEYLVNHGRMKEKVAREKFRQILSAVEYCHQKHIIHRDLKMENLLLDSSLNIKLADFGFANRYEEGKKLNTFCGSPPYAAPELFRGKEYEGPEVDVWSLGVILFKMVTGSLPFDGHSLSELRERILRGKYRIPFYMSTECERLLRKMLVLNPSKRFSLQEIMKDQWVNIGHENDILAPHSETKTDCTDRKKVEQLLDIGFGLETIIRSLKNNAFDEITATYFLLDKPNYLPTAESPTQAPNSFRSNSEAHTPNANEGEKVITVKEIEDAKAKQSEMIDSTKPDEPKSAEATESKNVPHLDDTHHNGVVTRTKNTENADGEWVISVDKKLDTKTWEQPPASNNPHDKIQNSTHRSPGYSVGPHTEENSSDRLPTGWCSPVLHGTEGLKNGTITTSKPATISVTSKGLQRTSSMYTPNGTDRKLNGRLQIISECKPKELVYVSARPKESDNSPPTRIELMPSNIMEVEPTSPTYGTSNFSRMSSMRQTVHSAYRPDIKLPVEPPGVAGTKGAPLANPRSNLSKFDEDEEDEQAPDESPGTAKSKGIFRTITAKFNKRTNPNHEPESPIEQHTTQRNSLLTDNTSKLSHMFDSGSQEEDTRPKSVLVPGPTRYLQMHAPTQTVTPEPIILTSAPRPTDVAEHNEKNKGGFMRAISLRFSKRKPVESTYNTNSVPKSADTSTVSKSSATETGRNFSMPQSIINSVSKPISNTPNSRLTSGLSEIANGPHSNGTNTSKSSIECKAEDQPRPKVFRFKWNMKATSTLHPDELVAEVKRVLLKNAFNYVQRNRFLFICTDGQNACELEICEAPRINQRGLRFKKLTGTSVNYKTMYTRILDDMNI